MQRMSHPNNPRALLTPVMRGVIDRMARAGRPPMHSMTPEQARAFYEVGSGVLDIPPHKLARVEDLASRPVFLGEAGSDGETAARTVLEARGIRIVPVSGTLQEALTALRHGRIAALFALGFSHVEIGTITPRPQPGNEKPRIFRLPEHRALINRMGFNNEGAEACGAARPGRRPPSCCSPS